MKPALVVLAAGIGSRYGGLKQIDPVGPNGEIILDYSIYDAINAGFGKIVFVIRKDIEKPFRELIGAHWEKKIHVEYVFQELHKVPASFKVPADRQKPWGTGHAIMMSEDVVKEPFAVINADDFYGRSGYKLLSSYFASIKEERLAEFCMVGFMVKNTLSEFGSVSRGVCETDATGFLKDVVERTKIEKEPAGGARYFDDNGNAVKLSGSETVSMNMWGFTPSLYPHLKRLFNEFLEKRGNELKSEFYIPSVVNDLIKADKARCKVLQSQDSWFGITYKEDKPMVQDSIRKLVASKVYPDRIF